MSDNVKDSTVLSKKLNFKRVLFSVFREKKWWYHKEFLMVDDKTRSTVKRMLEDLPQTLFDPEITITSSGHVVFEWRSGPSQVITIEVMQNTIAYCYMFKGMKECGQYTCFGKIPEDLVSIIRDYFC